MNQINDVVPDLRLRFHLEHPDFDNVWLEGYEAGSNNLSEALNPYPQNTREYEFWEEGWWAGFYDEPPVFATQLETIKDVVVDTHNLRPANEPIKAAGRKDNEKVLTVVFELLCAAVAIWTIYAAYDLAA